MTLASALDSLNTFRIEPLDMFLKVALVVVSFLLLAVYLSCLFVLRPLAKRLWHWQFHGLSRPLIIAEILLIVMILAIAGGFIAIIKDLWPSYTSQAILAVWTLAIAYVLLKPLCFRISQEFSQAAGYELSECLAVILIVPWRWAKELLQNGASRRPVNPMARPITEPERDPEAF